MVIILNRSRICNAFCVKCAAKLLLYFEQLLNSSASWGYSNRLLLRERPEALYSSVSDRFRILLFDPFPERTPHAPLRRANLHETAAGHAGGIGETAAGAAGIEARVIQPLIRAFGRSHGFQHGSHVFLIVVRISLAKQAFPACLLPHGLSGSPDARRRTAARPPSRRVP